MQSHVCWAYFTLDGRHLTLVTAPLKNSSKTLLTLVWTLFILICSRRTRKQFCYRMPLVHSLGNLIARLHMHPDTFASSRLCHRTSLGCSGTCPSTVQTDGVILSDVWTFVSTQSTDLYKRIKVENISQM